MQIQENISRIFKLQGTSNLEKSYSINEEFKELREIICNYYARIELSENNNEISNELEFNIKTPWLYVYGENEGEKISYSDLLKKFGKIPLKRSEKENKIITLPSELQEFKINSNIQILSPYSGFWENWRKTFDEEKTYTPIIKNIFDELVNYLKQNS